MVFAVFEGEKLQSYRHLAIILRLSVLLNHARNDENVIDHIQSITLDEQTIRLTFKRGWLSKNPLTMSDLEQEQHFLFHSGFFLEVK